MSNVLDYEAIGHRLKMARRKSGYTQEKMAEKLGMSIGYISQVERGLKHFNLSRLYQVSKIYGISIGYLIEGNAETEAIRARKKLLEAVEGYSDKEVKELVKTLKVG